MIYLYKWASESLRAPGYLSEALSHSRRCSSFELTRIPGTASMRVSARAIRDRES